ncbi:PIN domain-containing protein [Photorhabdus asymbiotica]|uniref:PIN domain-containing protein n=1 Tax=Photorhabdus asymbiotica TaxID=291112 RepID=UPI003DA6E208
MLDTNVVGHFIRGHHSVVQRVLSVPMSSLCISAITEGELLFALARRPEVKRLRMAVREFLMSIDVLPWDNSVAERYGMIKADIPFIFQVTALLAAFTHPSHIVIYAPGDSFTGRRAATRNLV